MCMRCDLKADGREAALLGLTLSCCPYTQGSVAAELWCLGFVQEKVDDEEVTLALIHQSVREGRIVK